MKKINGPFSLKPFDLKGAPEITIESMVTETDESFFISFRLKGALSSIDLGPGCASHQRVTGLWKKSCFEFFIKNERGNYLEYNFSPAFEWDCFYFEKKGDPLTQYPMNKPKEDILHALDVFHLIAEVPKESMPKDFRTDKMQINLTSVIENKEDNKLSYWALSHKDSKPNFHYFESFISMS